MRLATERLEAEQLYSEKNSLLKNLKVIILKS